MSDYLLYLLYKFFKFTVLLLPKFLVKFFLDGFAYLAYLVNTEHRRYAKINLDYVYKDTISEKRKQEIIKNSYKNLVYNVYEFIENQTLDLKGLEKKITVENEQVLLDAIKSKRKLIMISAHYGNWEYGSNFFPLKYVPITMVGRPINNKYLNDELVETRIKNHSNLINKNEASRGLVKALKQDRVIGLVIDHHNGAGIDVQFLGHKVKQTDSTSRLAIKFDALIIPMFFRMDSFGKYTAVVKDVIDSRNFTSENNIEELTQAQADVIEKQIFEKPDIWFWQHKRFKEYDKEIYEQ